MIFLSLVVVALIAGNVALTVSFSKERARLLDALVCRTPGEYVALRKADAPARPKADRDADNPIIPVGL